MGDATCVFWEGRQKAGTEKHSPQKRDGGRDWPRPTVQRPSSQVCAHRRPLLAAQVPTGRSDTMSHVLFTLSVCCTELNVFPSSYTQYLLPLWDFIFFGGDWELQ